MGLLTLVAKFGKKQLCFLGCNVTSFVKELDVWSVWPRGSQSGLFGTIFSPPGKSLFNGNNGSYLDPTRMLTTAELITKHWNGYTLDGHPVTMDFFCHDLGLWQWKTRILSANTCQKDPGLSTDCEMSPYCLLLKFFFQLYLIALHLISLLPLSLTKRLRGLLQKVFPLNMHLTPTRQTTERWVFLRTTCMFMTKLAQYH